MTRSFNDGLSFWIHKDVIEDIFWPLKHHRRSAWVVLGDSDIKSLNSHRGKNCLLLTEGFLWLEPIGVGVGDQKKNPLLQQHKEYQVQTRNLELRHQ